MRDPKFQQRLHPLFQRGGRCALDGFHVLGVFPGALIGFRATQVVDEPVAIASHILNRGAICEESISVTCYDYLMTSPTKAPPPTSARGRPRKLNPLTAAERMRRMRARRRASGLRAITRWEPQQTVYSEHRLIEARSLAMHAAIARKIDRDPRLIDIPRRNLVRWAARMSPRPPHWLREWRGLLKRPWPELAAIMTEPSENGARLRQSSPFAGVLSASERARIYEAFRA